MDITETAIVLQKGNWQKIDQKLSDRSALSQSENSTTDLEMSSISSTATSCPCSIVKVCIFPGGTQVKPSSG